MGQAFKMKPVREIMEKEGVTLEEIAYVGDDVIDLPVMRECGFCGGRGRCAGALKAEAHYVTPTKAGAGRRGMRWNSSLRRRACSTIALRPTSMSAIRFRRR